ncbi:MAG: hypothetical protein FJY92_08215, partial [Candidatus Hydrogenedentes bacterium]|nr:hypothetical protein [Candidatus Hydrogenedentota bacterium]
MADYDYDYDYEHEHEHEHGKILSDCSHEESMNDETHDDTQPERAYFSHDVVRGIPWAIVTKLLLVGVQFGVSLASARMLDLDQYGMVRLAEVIGTWITIVCGLGLNTSLARFGPELVLARDRSGFLRLTVGVAVVQGVMVFAATALLVLLRSPLDTYYFKVVSGAFLFFVAFAFGARMFRTLIEDVFTLLLQMRLVSFLSLAHGIAWLALLVAFCYMQPTANAAMAARGVSVALYVLVGGALLVRAIGALEWQRGARH